MKNLRLIPPLYKQEPVLNVNFAFDPTLNALVLSQKGARWSQTLDAWCFPKKAFQFAKGTAIRLIEFIKQQIPIGYTLKTKVTKWLEWLYRNLVLMCGSYPQAKNMKKAVCSLLMILSCTHAIGQEWNKQIDDFLKIEFSKFNIPSLEVLVVNKDSILYSKSIGKSSPSSTYYIGSVSKSLTAYGILKLIEQNKISFDTKIVDIIPEIQFQNSGEKITIWHLLTQTSGIKKKSGFRHLPSLKELKSKRFKISNQSIEPLKHEYSYLNYALLGLIIERITNLSFKDYMYSNVFEPLKMNDSKIGSRDELSTQLINHYQYFGPFPVRSKQIEFDQSSIPAGFICSSSEDLGKYIQLNLSKGKFRNIALIDSSLIQTMHTVWNKGEYGYAMGWKQGEYNHFKFYQHLGTTANSYSAILSVKSKEFESSKAIHKNMSPESWPCPNEPIVK